MRRNWATIFAAVTCLFTVAVLLTLAAGETALAQASAGQPQSHAASPSDPRLDHAYRFQQGGWTYVHLEGSPEQIGFQHGYLLAPEIADAFAAIKLQDTHRTQRPWEFFRKVAREQLWPKIDPEYQKELSGIAAGLKAHHVAMDVDDVVALNAFLEVARLLRALAESATEGRQRSAPGESGQLQRVYRHGQIHARPQNRDGAQRLDQLSGRRALGDCL